MDMPGSSCEGPSSEHLLVRPGRRPKRKTRGGESRRPTSTTRSPIHCRHFPNGRARFSKNAAMPSLKISYRRRGDPAITLGLEQHVEGSGRRLMHEPLDRRIGQGRPLGDPAGQPSTSSISLSAGTTRLTRPRDNAVSVFIGSPRLFGQLSRLPKQGVFPSPCLPPKFAAAVN